MSDTPELKAFKQQRQVLRTSATKNLQKLSRIDAISDENEVESKSLLKSLKDTRARLQHISSQIQIGLGESDLVADVEKSFEYDERLGEGVNNLEANLEIFESNRNAQRVAQHAAQAVKTEGGAVSKTAKYPKLELTTFGGDPLQWESFWDDFSNSVDQRPELTVIDKFKILKKSLTDDALKVADGYLLTAANYAQVKENLQERFGDPEVAIFAHFEALLALSPANHDISQLRSVCDTCEAHIRSLVALGLSEDTFGLVFTPILLSKLPKFVKIELYRRNGSRKWSLANLRELLRDEIKARDKSERSLASSNGKQGSGQGSGGKKGGTAGSMVINTPRGGKGAGNNQGRNQSCAFCSGLHASWKCRKFPDCDSRRAQVRGKCSGCLQPGHSTKACPTKVPCFYCAKDNHHSSLCFQKFGSNSGKPASGGAEKKAETGASTDSSNIVSSLNADAPVFRPAGPEAAAVASTLQAKKAGVAVVKAARVQVLGQHSSVVAQVVFDDCSTTSFISTRLAMKIGAKRVGTEYRSVGHFGSNKRKSLKWCSYEVSLRASNGSLKSIILHGMDQICPPIRVVPLGNSASSIIQSLELAQPLVDAPLDAEVDILVGLDYYNDFLLDDEFRVNGLIFRKSVFGFLASGFLPSEQSSVDSNGGNQQFISSVPESANYDLERMWRVEDLGIKEDPSQKKEDEQVFQEFEKTIQRSPDGRYFVRWPYRSSNPEISDTFHLALVRLRVLMRKLAGNEAVLESYEQIFADQLDRGIIEEAPDQPQGAVFYMPHHTVIKPDRVTTKVRIVYDASAKAGKNGLSLNDCLHRGPLILEDLLGLVSRFRFNVVAFMADIEKAFHTVGLQEDERDVTRFLWVRDKSKPVAPDNLVIYRFARVPFGCVSSSFLLSGTIVHHLRQSGSELADEILSFLYVDNVIGDRPTPSSALDFFEKSKRLFEQASMNLRQWYTNNAEFREALPQSDRAQGSDTSVLGLVWNFSSDTLSCKAGPALTTRGQSKRQILKGLASFYDPCGWFSPISISARILMQKIWINGSGWDEVLPTGICSEWVKIQSELQNAIDIRIPRYLQGFPKSPTSENVQLHGFVDASAKAYATAIYVRYFDESSEHWRSDLLIARARVAPLKCATIPKLELMAALIGARLLATTRVQLRITDIQTILWSDSTCVLAWLSGTTSCTLYVSNRANEIREKQLSDIRYVPTAENPADINSRGTSTEKLRQSTLWWHGPHWLVGDKKQWPGQPSSAIAKSVEREQVSNQDVSVEVVATETAPSIIDLKRFSDLSKLLRVTAYVFRVFAKNKAHSLSLDALELHKAQCFWNKQVQHSFIDNSSMLKAFKQLRPYQDDHGIIRCRGRFAYSGLPQSAKDPILLPRYSDYTRLLIKDFHENSFHAGAKHTLALFRQQYWISAGLSTVKSLLHECVVCRNVDGGHYRLPEAGPLPDFRTQAQRPFSCIGLDYLGPLYVRAEADTPKVWVCLFTCATTRAIHLEMAHSLSAVDSLLCLRRFVARYGAPKVVVSDNAKQFKAVEKGFRREWFQVTRDSAVQSYAAKQRIQWVFIPELTPWMGGFYERLVRPVKTSLKKSLGKQLVSAEELSTLLYEISSVLNSRPLTYVGGEFEKHYLCPLDFLSHGGTFLHSEKDDPDPDFAPRVVSAENLIASFKGGQRLLDQFWNIWQNSYLTSLRESHHDAKQRKVVGEAPKLGHTVIVKDPGLPRAQWKLGRISKLFTSRDGYVRSVEVTLPSKKTLRRPLKLLYPLELSEAFQSPGGTSPNQASSFLPRPARQAALRAKEVIKAQAEEQLGENSD